MSNAWSGVAIAQAPRRPACRSRASANVSRTVPVCRSADWLVTLTVNSSTSPSRRNRGGFGWTIRSLAVTALSCSKPLRSCASWAKPRNFHSVSASGMVNSIFTSPSASAIRCGKKKAVSFRFLRAETLLRSGAGGRRRLAAPPALLSRRWPGPSPARRRPSASSALPGRRADLTCIAPPTASARRSHQACRASALAAMAARTIAQAAPGPSAQRAAQIAGKFAIAAGAARALDGPRPGCLAGAEAAASDSRTGLIDASGPGGRR